ncbi:MAG: hypothetical protein JW841_03910 [Deltaproteobacteria bacterium]|nr:hypothetical protein [Deltaproteobacteria bacterium]
MSERLFISQSQLEGFVEQGEATFENDILTSLAEQRSHKLAPAVRVLSLIDGQDQLQLIGKIITINELNSLKVEHYTGTIISGDTGYECEEGYVGILQDEPIFNDHIKIEATPSTESNSPSIFEDDKSDSELLADFLLKNLQ